MSTFVIARRGPRGTSRAVGSLLLYGGPDDDEAVPLFSSREQAESYLHSAGWRDAATVVELVGCELGRWLADVIAAGVRFLSVDPSHRDQQRGEPLPVIDLEEQLTQMGMLLAADLKNDEHDWSPTDGELEVYHCHTCGRIVMEHAATGPPLCCQEEMAVLTFESSAARSGPAISSLGRATRSAEDGRN